MKNQMNRKQSGKRTILMAIALVIVLLLTNPSLMFFLPGHTRESMKAVYQGLFGDVDQVVRVFRLNWISFFKVIVIILSMLIIKYVAGLILDRIHPKTAKGQSILTMVKSFFGYAVALIMLIWCLSAVGINPSTIFASIGIVALVIGFAAEGLIEDVVTGLFLIFEDEFNVGDIVEVNGFRGTVLNIGVRVTSIQDTGGNIKLVNNSDLKNILNRSRTSSSAVCDIPIPYTADLEKTEAVLQKTAEEIVEKYPDLFMEAPEYLGVQGLDRSTVNLRFSARVEEKNLYKAARIMLREFKLGIDAQEN